MYVTAEMQGKRPLRDASAWWAEGVIFENCNCRLLCHCHISFRQPADNARCRGYWAIHFTHGAYDRTPLDALNAVVVYDAPQLMVAPDWTQALYLDERADAAQRDALETILTGRAGGGWAKLGALVSTRLETRYVPIHLEIAGRRKAVRIDGALEGSVDAIRGADKVEEVRLLNSHNQLHGRSQVLARGSTQFADHGLRIEIDQRHALYSRFYWIGP